MSNNRLVDSNYDALYRRRRVIEAATSAVIVTWQFYGPGGIAEAALVNSALGSAFTYNSLNQLTSYQRGDVTVSGNTGSIAGATLTQDMAWNPQGALILESVNGTTVLNNLGNAQNQNTSNTYNSNGDASSSTNAAGSAVNTVFNAWGQVVSYTVSQTANGINFTQTETIQYDALGRPLGEFQSGTFPGEATAIQTQHTLSYNAITGRMVSDTNAITTSGTAPEGTDPARYVYAPSPDSNSSSSDIGTGSNLLLREMGTFGATTPAQYIYALTDPTGTVIAIASAAGTVDERYVFDGLGNAQALQANGTPYDVTTFSNPNRSANWQFQQQFSGSTFNTGTQLITYAGTDFAWNIVYHGQICDGIPGVYQTANGAFDPREQSLLAPNLGAIQQGISAYNPTAGETGFSGWYDRNANTIAGLSETGLGLAGIYLTGGLAELASPFISSALGLSGTTAAGAAIVAEETSGTVGALEDWEGANAAARLAARDAAFETDNAVNATNTAANVENTVNRSVVIAKATVGAVSGGISGIVGSIADHGSIGQDILAGALGAAAGAATSGAGAFLRFGIASQLAAGAVGSAGGNLFAQSVSYAFRWRGNIDLSEVATSGVAGAFAPLFSGAAIVDRLLGEESEPLLIYASGLPMAAVEGLTHVGLESLITGSVGLAGTGG